jgi:hypothetical protein
MPTSESNSSPNAIPSTPPSDRDKAVRERWETARKSAATTTSITLVLFGALIVSWLGMWEGVHKYRSAIASRLWADKRNHQLDDNDAVALSRGTKAELVAQALLRRQDKADRDKLLSLAEKVDRPPYAVALFNQLEQQNPNAFETQSLERAISTAEDQFHFANGQNFKRFHARRATAEKTTFKLLGLDFSVNGFWAWIVWLSFLTGGVLYLWLARRSLIREGRRLGEWQMSISLDAAMAETLRDSLPLWVRPLRRSEKWARSFVSNARTDLASDPLGALTLVLMAVCLVLSLETVRTGIISTSLLRSEVGFSWPALLHAVILCTLVGLLIGLITNWFSSPGGTALDPEILGRRVLISSAASASLVGLFYLPKLNLQILKSILTEPRHRLMNVVRFRRRRPKVEKPKMAPGFYVDVREQIHYVPPGGHCRSLSRTEGPVVHWNGPFDSDALPRVHRSARVPYIREGVTKILSGFQHRNKDEFRSAIQSPEWRSRHARAFDLVRAELSLENQQSANAMPNLQLYDLLAAIAINSGSDSLVTTARQLLQKAFVPASSPAQTPKYLADAAGAKHSRHSAKRAKGAIFQEGRRQGRLDSFIRIRLGIQQSSQSKSHNRSGIDFSPSVQGTWKTPVDPQVANYIHVLRQPRKRRRNRLHVNSKS